MAYNTGVIFLPNVPLVPNTELSKSVSSSVSAFANVGVAISAVLVTLLPRGIASKSDGVSRNVNALMDVDGDGLPDIVSADGTNVLKVRRNLTGRTNLLRSVTLPFGGHVRVEYRQTLPSFAMPGRRWVMSAVETSGGYAENGATSATSSGSPRS